jgi:hypothetical protein
VADLTNPRVLGRGLNAEIQAAGPPVYPQCQAWAGAVQAAGFGGIRYHARHGPSLDAISYALFGGPGEDDKRFASRSTFPIPTYTIDDLITQFELPILPRVPPAPWSPRH